MYNIIRKVEEVFSPYKFCLSKVIQFNINFQLYWSFLVCIFEKIACVTRAIFFMYFCMEVFNIKQDFLVNSEIRFPQVQVITEQGEKLGLMSINKALEIAEGRNLDLVLVSPNPSNPVCKLLDYSKFKFEMNKKAKEAKKKQKVIEIKEIRLSPNIDKHDLEVKAKNANKFIATGNKVKVSMRFRGRELNFIKQGKEIMLQFIEMLDNVQIDKEPKMEGKNLTTFLSPKQK